MLKKQKETKQTLTRSVENTMEQKQHNGIEKKPKLHNWQTRSNVTTKMNQVEIEKYEKKSGYIFSANINLIALIKEKYNN